jgi:hypothetical protein
MSTVYHCHFYDRDFCLKNTKQEDETMVGKIEMARFLRSFKISPNGQMAFFLGSGASIQAGIPTGLNLVWKRTLLPLYPAPHWCMNKFH